MAGSASSSAAAGVMQAIHEKKTVSVEIYRPLRNYIVSHYSEREAQNLEDDLETVKQFRSDLERSSDTPDVRRDLLQSYFKALCVMESRFPISPEKDQINAINFTWYDTFKQKQKASQQNIHLEKAARVVSILELFTARLLLLLIDRIRMDLRSRVIRLWLRLARLRFLKDSVSVKASIAQSNTVDISG